MIDNRFENLVEVYPIALGSGPGVGSLFGRGQGASLVPGWGGLPTYDSTCVSVLPLDSIIGNRFDGRRIILKIDVEGGEWDLLAGAQKLLEQRPTVLMELSFSRNHPDGRHPRFRQVLELFWGMNYRIEDPIGARERALVTPARVDSWYQSGTADMSGENMWLVPL